MCGVGGVAYRIDSVDGRNKLAEDVSNDTGYVNKRTLQESDILLSLDTFLSQSLSHQHTSLPIGRLLPTAVISAT